MHFPNMASICLSLSHSRFLPGTDDAEESFEVLMCSSGIGQNGETICAGPKLSRREDGFLFRFKRLTEVTVQFPVSAASSWLRSRPSSVFVSGYNNRVLRFWISRREWWPNKFPQARNADRHVRLAYMRRILWIAKGVWKWRISHRDNTIDFPVNPVLRKQFCDAKHYTRTKTEKWITEVWWIEFHYSFCD